MKTIVAVVAILALSVSCAFAQFAPEVLKVTGDVKIMKKGANTWAACAEKSTIADGDRITTANGASATIGFVENRKNIARIGANTEIIVADGSEPTYTINLLIGEVSVLAFNMPEGSTFDVTTPAGVGGAKGTGWRVLTDGTTATYEVYDNTIYVKGLYANGSVSEDTAFVDMGYKTVVKKFEMPGPVKKLAPEDMDRWNVWRDEVKNLQAKSTMIKNQAE